MSSTKQYKNMDELIQNCLRVAKEGEKRTKIPYMISFRDMIQIQLEDYAKRGDMQSFHELSKKLSNYGLKKVDQN